MLRRRRQPSERSMRYRKIVPSGELPRWRRGSSKRGKFYASNSHVPTSISFCANFPNVNETCRRGQQAIPRIIPVTCRWIVAVIKDNVGITHVIFLRASTYTSMPSNIILFVCSLPWPVWGRGGYVPRIILRIQLSWQSCPRVMYYIWMEFLSLLVNSQNGITLNTGFRPFGIWISYRCLDCSFNRFNARSHIVNWVFANLIKRNPIVSHWKGSHRCRLYCYRNFHFPIIQEKLIAFPTLNKSNNATFFNNNISFWCILQNLFQRATSLP